MTRSSRVFPIEEWAPAQESRASMNALKTDFEPSDTKQPFERQRFRKRLQSLPLAGREEDIIEGVRDLNFGTYDARPDAKKIGGIRGLIRRASISIKNRQRRHSEAVEERPQTANPWRRLKTAASFHRHSKFLSVELGSEMEYDAPEEMTDVRTGNGPYIPHGGHAARVAAAQQNEYFGRNRQLFLAGEQLEDRESGIGIAVTSTSLDPAEFSDRSTMGDISRIDFVSELPAELAVQILTHLDQETLRRLPLVCQKWNHMSLTQSIWKDVLLRDQTKTYATSKPLALGAGLGLPPVKPGTDWKDIYRIREQLKRNWLGGTEEAVYLNGHLDSIYCVQFDE